MYQPFDEDRTYEMLAEAVRNVRPGRSLKHYVGYCEVEDTAGITRLREMCDRFLEHVKSQDEAASNSSVETELITLLGGSKAESFWIVVKRRP